MQIAGARAGLKSIPSSDNEEGGLLPLPLLLGVFLEIEEDEIHFLLELRHRGLLDVQLLRQQRLFPVQQADVALQRKQLRHCTPVGVGMGGGCEIGCVRVENVRAWAGVIRWETM